MGVYSGFQRRRRFGVRHLKLRSVYGPFATRVTLRATVDPKERRTRSYQEGLKNPCRPRPHHVGRKHRGLGRAPGVPVNVFFTTKRTSIVISARSACLRWETLCPGLPIWSDGCERSRPRFPRIFSTTPKGFVSRHTILLLILDELF